MPDGTMVVVLMNRMELVCVKDRRSTHHADLSAFAINKINDMVVDEKGRAYVSQHGCNLIDGPLKASPLIFVAEDGKVSVAAEDLMTPNGIAILPDGKTLAVAETRAERIAAFDLAVDGSLSNRRIFAEFPAPSCPDGICCDAEGALWVACAVPHGGRLVRVEAGGRVTHSMHMGEGQLLYASMLGGEDGKSLFLCVGDSYLPEDARARRSGKIEVLRVDVPHAGLP
jgi:sugar lactone lactonase YvrE